ncbi:MAG: cell envelope integrity protein TolA, partial [Deltaproteobacteria bacterium]
TKPKPAPKPPPKKAEAKPKPADKAQAEPAAKTQAKPSPTTGKAAGEPRAGTPAPATSGNGSSGGGAVVRDAAFVRYYNLMIDAIRQHWVWVGSERDNLSVTVRFAVAPDGTIQGVRRTSSSGNPHFDQSVENAVRSVGRLEPPPVKYRRDFADVELIFRASDLARR